MRDVFHEELDAIEGLLVSMAGDVRTQMGRASAALMSQDLAVAERVISNDDHVDAMRRMVEQRALAVMATQQPVARDLRALVTSLRIVMDLERMGDLAVHIAKLTRRRYPGAVIAPRLAPTICAMAETADAMTRKCQDVLATADVATASCLERDDDAMDEAHRQLLQILLNNAERGTIEEAVNATLCGRFYERFADHAVNIGTRLVFQVSGGDGSPALAR